ncbi:MAG: matrixin family metalloprotease [Candidatus Krumholzibacteriota bacterium]|nr:matrixin family metalloprotease [Candidatus Krumholzibacteriota bacterium]
MRKIARITASFLLSIGLFSSCIFQNDPASPNIPPVIEWFSPLSNDTTLVAPGEKMFFEMRAFDLDRDELSYEFIMSTLGGSVFDSVLSSTSSAEFRAIKGGRYRIEGSVRDGEDKISVFWFVEVFEAFNEPPVITGFIPEMEYFSCLLMEPVEFRIAAWDEEPEYLQYQFWINGVNVTSHVWSPHPYISHKFEENGSYEVLGIVDDWEFADSILWYVNVTGDRDTIDPGIINNLEGWTGNSAGSIFLRWTAPGDDGDQGTVFGYKVKTSTIPIITEEGWLDASYKAGTPEPGAPGTVENMTVYNCYPGTNLYVTVRAFDDFGNLGPIGNCISLLVRGYDLDGYLFDASNGLSLSDASVSAGMISTVSESDGYYMLRNLPRYATWISVRDESDYGVIGDYHDFLYLSGELNSNATRDFYLLPAFPDEVGVDDKYQDFLMFFKDLTNTEGLLGAPTIYYGWDHWPLTVYNPPMVWKDVDLQEVARGSMASWEDGTGLDLFTEVEYPQIADVKIVYFSVGEDKHTVKTIEYNPDGTPEKKEVWIFLQNTLSPVATKGHMIFAHEFGHVVGISHSLDTAHLMIGMTTPFVNDPSIDEFRLLKVIYHTPAIFDSDWFVRE